ncbi:MAG: HAD family phosphatase [Endomicrobia bacterium]|nr:HAD family phosphatase [Endomicrobiia bacterium]
MINFSDYEVIFFDFDGVIADTEWQHFSAFNKVLNKYGIKISKSEYLNEYLAYDDKGCFTKVFRKKLKRELSDKEIKKLILEKTKILMTEIKKNFKYYDDAIKFINYLSRKFKNIKLCIVSGALKREIVYILKKLNIYKHFFVIISAEDVKNGKPSPEPFFVAKSTIEKKLNKKFNNEKILVVEDSINGIKSAMDAGFKVVAVGHAYQLSKLKRTKPYLLVKNLTQLLT